MKHVLNAISAYLIMMLISQTSLMAQEATAEERLGEMSGRLNALDEKSAIHETDLGKLTKIKVSGYIQAQFETYQGDLVRTNEAFKTFYVRRARVKFTYEATDGVKFVLQPDFSTGNLSLKDAYAVASLPQLPWLSLWAGQFNRPSYEAEYSSGQREVLERSRLIRTIYPGEREVGAKLEAIPARLPLKLQLAVLNGNFTGKEQKDGDTRKDIMARAIYSITIPGTGIGIDLGSHTYYGGLRSKNVYISGSDNILDSTSLNTGSYMDKKWFGAEMQMYFDLLGGMAVKGEYIAGQNAYAGDSRTNPNIIRKFKGYYAYLIKNIGTKNQLVARYDHFDPNTKVSGDNAGKEVYYSTLTLAWQYYLNDNIRFSVNYEMPKNEESTAVPDDLEDNVLGIRMQARF